MKKRKRQGLTITKASDLKTTQPKQKLRERVHAGRGHLKGSALLRALAAEKKIERDL
jgi:hypothetical protein